MRKVEKKSVACVGLCREAGISRDRKDEGTDGKYRRFRMKEHQPTKGRCPSGGRKWKARR